MPPISPFDGQWRKVARVILKHPYTLLMAKDTLEGGMSIFSIQESQRWVLEGDVVRKFLDLFDFPHRRVAEDTELSINVQHIAAQAEENLGGWEADTYGSTSYPPDLIEVQLISDRMVNIRQTFDKGQKDEWQQNVTYTGDFVIEWAYPEKEG